MDYIQRGDPITAKLLNEIIDRLVGRITVTGGRVSRVGQNIIIEVDKGRSSAAKPVGLAAIMGSREITGHPNRNEYTMKWVKKVGEEPDGEWESYGEEFIAYNFVEKCADSEFLGTGIATANLTTNSASFQMVVPKSGTPYPIYIVYPAGGTTAEYWFSCENQVDGGCIDELTPG